MNEQFAQRLAEAWIGAWNRQDFEAILPTMQQMWILPVHLCRRYPGIRPARSTAANG